MNISLGRTVLLVKDYDEALRFYRDVFGARILFDQDSNFGLRFLHIALGNDTHGIWLLKAENREERIRVGQQTADQPALVLYTDDLAACYRHMKLKNVTIKLEPATNPVYSFFHCLDLYGNELVIVQLAGEN